MLATGLVAHFISLTALLPFGVNVLAGGLLFCLVPGLGLFSLISGPHRNKYSLLTLMVLSCSLGFLFNFLANVAIFLLHPSLDQVVPVYLLTVAAIYVHLIRQWRRLGARFFHRAEPIDRVALAAVVVFGVAFAVVLYHRLPTRLFAEEFIILRKLLENPSLAANNISFSSGDYTTYYFVPFFLLIALVAKFSIQDVLLVVPAFWPFVSMVSALCLVANIRLVSGQHGGAIPLLAMALVQAAFIGFGAVMIPQADRYWVAAGLLIPLVLFHFLLHIQDREINKATLLGLIFLIVEMTFIHAKETLYFLGFVLLLITLFLVDLRNQARLLVKIGCLLLIVVGILLLYRYVNLQLQPYLQGYMGDETRVLREGLEQIIRETGFLGLFNEAPWSMASRYGYDLQIGYWRVQDGMMFMPVTLWLLPLYVLVADRVSRLYLPLMVAGLALFHSMTGLTLAAALMVGSHQILDFSSVLLVLTAMVFADLAFRFWVLARAYLSRPETRKPVLALGAVLALLCAVGLGLVENRYITGHHRSDQLLYLVTIVLIFRQARQLRRTAPAPETKSRRLEWWEVGGLALIGMASVTFMPWKANGHWQEVLADAPKKHRVWRPDWLKEDFAESYRAVVATCRFVCCCHGIQLPADVIRFVRAQVPHQEIWYSSLSLPLVLISNQYTPLVTDGTHFVNSFIKNYVVLSTYFARVDTRGERESFQDTFERLSRKVDFIELLGDEELRPGFEQLLQDHDVGWVMLLPRETARLDWLLKSHPELAARLERRFESGGWAIYRWRT